MKNFVSIFMLLGFIFFSYVLIAQESVDRPKDVGVSDYDNFKNSSFDVQDESASLKENVTQIDNEIKQYSGVMNTLSVSKIRENLTALKESKQAVKVLSDKLADLSPQGKTLVENAKNVTPKMKSVSASKNTNKSMKALDLSKNDLKSVGEMLEADISLLTEELKSRGEPVE